MQFKQFDEGTHLSLDHSEFEDMAAALATASTRLRAAAVELPKIQQRKQLSEQADRFDQMLGEMLSVAKGDLADLACSAHDRSLPQKD